MAERKSRKAPLPLEYRHKGKGKRKCRFCGNARGMIRSYDLHVCRRCFREVGERIGFRKY